ncbi:UDP-3-O-(3-hydroxymyristoyl) glucosamine N-acyltransferase [Desulfovibrio sp. X2]|uniref:UDP-3-O-(3-hydroxymyristoyl)glucosamine N-acyltransferase n=1 Tax=Desulfovibrio sp. X2 TaxID=941449 RepID=UPI000358E568|nr:UDP-3-O-(3-hydroxymyristoyl)glucosamine N-acyltransferase [Desulfovibrio sp. X2]EPR37473.1 UDP-3-O-(3-hydroxymyristoyl) glucosamine N-acyltransferase [Desulfovibrio sp. X2]
MRITLSELASRFGLRLVGQDREIQGVNTLEKASPDELSFLANPKYAPALKTTQAGCVIVSEKHAGDVPCALVSDNPYLSLARIATLFAPPQGCQGSGTSPLAFVHEEASVSPEAVVYPFAFVGPRSRVAAGARIFPHCYVGEECEIGEGTTLYPGVTLMAGVKLGRGVICHPGAVLGSDGFGYAQGPEGLVKVPQIGPVVIGDGVEVGANATVDRGSLGTTEIRSGAKVDNLCQIAHNVRIGEHSILVAQVGVSGSTTIGRGVILAGQVGVVGHLEIGDGAIVGAQSGVGQSLPAGARVSGSPAYDHGAFLRNAVLLPKLPELVKRVNALEKEISELRKRGTDDNDG